MRSVIAGGISFLLGLVIVTSLELGVGKSLSCWVWNECPEAAAYSSDGQASTTSTLPSILGGGSSVDTNTARDAVKSAACGAFDLPWCFADIAFVASGFFIWFGDA
jgi:hypothetical protein